MRSISVCEKCSYLSIAIEQDPYVYSCNCFENGSMIDSVDFYLMKEFSKRKLPKDCKMYFEYLILNQ